MDEQDEIPTAELEQPLLARFRAEDPARPGTTELFGGVLPVPGQDQTIGGHSAGERTTAEFSALLPTPSSQRRALPRPLESGCKIGELTLGQVLERTPGSEAFLAVHPRYGTCRVTVATPAATVHSRERLLEARLRTTFSRPGLARVLELGSQPRPWIAEAHVEGPTLGSLFSEGNHPKPETLGDLVLQTALALDHAHQARVVHGDLRPEDVILGKQESWLRGFGRTTVLDPRGERLAYPKGPAVGDARYASPERCRSGEQTAWGDIYSLGAVLYEGLTRRPPFQGTPPEILRGVLDRQPSFPSAKPGSLRAALLEVSKRALAKSPGQRFPTAGAFAEAVRRALGEAEHESSGGAGWLVPCLLLLALASVGAVALLLSY